MSRAMHITGYLGDEPRDRVFMFMDAAARLGCFHDVLPVRRMDGTIVAVTMYTRDADGDALLRACGRLSRILHGDTEFLSPWEPTRVIPGRGGGITGMVVTDSGELEGGATAALPASGSGAPSASWPSGSSP